MFPNVQAKALINQQETAVSTINNILGLETTKYNVATEQYKDDLYRDILPSKSTRVFLNSSTSNVSLLCTYVNDSLQMIYISSNEGRPFVKTQATNDIALAQDFLNNCQFATKDSLYESLKSIISMVEANKNVSITVNNIKLNVTALNDDTTFRWTYTLNGLESPDKCVSLRFKNGFLKYFVKRLDFL